MDAVTDGPSRVELGTSDPDEPFLAGVIEGFYGPPWSRAERLELFRWMSGCGLNTYLYAPKDDLKQRVLWREFYSPSESDELKYLINACHSSGIRFVYALSPGLSIHYSSEQDQQILRQRFEQMLTLGCRHFCLLFDDIPDRMDPADLERWASLASAQASVANSLFAWLREQQRAARFLFCPTPYCRRMAAANLGGANYLETLGHELNPGIDIFWTGPEIISREISITHVSELERLLRRKPLIWDNLHANDYDGRRFFCGPYTGRPAELQGAVSGILLNPNTEFPLNFVPIHTFGQWLKQHHYEPRAAHLEALRSWLPRFTTAAGPLPIDDLILLTDCFYLPHEDGPEAADLLSQLRSTLSKEPCDSSRALQPAKRLRDFCVRLPELLDRSLFHALSRRIWDLREELDLLIKYMEFKNDLVNRIDPFRSDFHLPHTFRGGFISQLQSLLMQQRDGTFRPGGTRGG